MELSRKFVCPYDFSHSSCHLCLGSGDLLTRPGNDLKCEQYSSKLGRDRRADDRQKDGNAKRNGLSLIRQRLSMIKKWRVFPLGFGIWLRPGRNLRNKSFATTV
jgi:hypothetical protein